MAASTSLSSPPDLNLIDLRSKFQTTLSTFASSNTTFEIVYTAGNPPPPASPFAQTSTLKTLFVLDSSFNPPTHAHLTIARQALLLDKGNTQCRLCLLLATENADKKPKPAHFEDRLVMMSLMAHNLRSPLRSAKSNDQDAGANTVSDTSDIDIDVAITKKPFFMDKAASIDASEVYGTPQQLHITGYDTITRIFNSSYYPPDQKLRVLEPFLSKHRLRVCYREGEVSRAEQDAYVEGIADGSREDEGMKREWRGMVELVDDAKGVNGISSTEARKAAVEGRRDDLGRLVGGQVAGYVMEQRLYEDAAVIEKRGIKPAN